MTATLPAGWMPIESAPKDGTGILGYWNTGALHDCSFGAVKFHRGAWWETNEDYKVSQPTHWMPLPAAPCQTCNGHGMVGGLTPHSGYDAEPCPDCTPPATTQDAPITVSLDPDPRGVSVGVWQGSHCIYNGAHAVPAPAAGDARDAERWRSFRNAITQQDLGWLDRMDTALTALGCDLDDETPPSADQVDAAADAAIAAQQGKGGEA